ncbi:uncharacterized protein VTP21DRAFT_9142 [Calcarisporiella thermophila]|uniref:uncharacterized protein n=1 Tax=Calcarisporiella thermophila TaxID=911321 RepID=UPI0037439AF1
MHTFFCIKREEELDINIARNIIADPSRIASLAQSNRLLNDVVDKYACSGYKLVGRYATLREKYRWRTMVVELDATTFDFGRMYEMEVETTEPERVRAELEDFLREHQLNYAYSTRNKFNNMVAGSIA